jgi:site-specific DNA-methyltransferase (adenine-specific)
VGKVVLEPQSLMNIYVCNDYKMPQAEKASSEKWQTPQWLYDKLHAEFSFNTEFDPCPITWREGLDPSGLDIEWPTDKGAIYVNPPYSRNKVDRWIEKAWRESQRGVTVVVLINATTDTEYFHDLIMPNASEVRFLRGRIKFLDEQGEEHTSNRSPSILVIFRQGGGRKGVVKYYPTSTKTSVTSSGP